MYAEKIQEYIAACKKNGTKTDPFDAAYFIIDGLPENEIDDVDLIAEQIIAQARLIMGESA